MGRPSGKGNTGKAWLRFEYGSADAQAQRLIKMSEEKIPPQTMAQILKDQEQEKKALESRIEG